MWKVSTVVCLKCLKRWVSIRERKVLLTQLECPQCGEQGYTIETGEETNERLCDSCKISKDGKCKLGLTNDENCLYFDYDERKERYDKTDNK